MTTHEPEDSIKTALESLPLFERWLMTVHFIDGNSVYVVMRRYKLKRKEVEALIETGLEEMRRSLSNRGIRAVQDLI